MNFNTFVKILIVCDLCMVTTRSAGNDDNRNYPRTPRTDEEYMRRKQESAKDKRVRISQDEETSERGRIIRESSAARRKRTGKTKIEHNPEGETSKSMKGTWTNDERKMLLRMAYAHHDITPSNKVGLFNWKPVVTAWYGKWNYHLRDLLRLELKHLRRNMQIAVKQFDNEGVEWSMELNDELIKMYFATEMGDESKHGERIYVAWVKKHPELYRLTPNYLIRRAKTMLSGVMKFSLDNPQEMIKDRQLVDWQPKHRKLLKFLWDRIPRNVPNRKQLLFDEAAKYCSALGYLDEDRVYRHAQWLTSKRSKNQEEIDIHDEYNPETTQAQYHSFIDDQNFLSLGPETHSHHIEMASTSSQAGPSHSQPEPDFDLNVSHSERQSPNTKLYLGYQSHDEDNN